MDSASSVIHAGSSGSGACAAGTVVYNNSGCTTAGHYAETNATSADDCCAQCAADAKCFGWTFHPFSGGVDVDVGGKCDVSDKPNLKIGVAGATCGCRTDDCSSTSTCKPVPRPTASTRVPLPPGITSPPHIVSILIDDLGMADTSMRNPNIDFTPNLQSLQNSGIRLDSHHTCVPS